MKWEVITGTRKGVPKLGRPEKKDNQDALFHRELDLGTEKILIIGVADGVTQCPYGGAIARWICKQLDEAAITCDSHAEISSVIPHLITEIRKTFAEGLGKTTGFPESSCTLTVGLIAGNHFHGFWVGDSPILFSRNVGSKLETHRLSTPDHTPEGKLSDYFGVESPLQLKHVERDLRHGDVVTLATDGFTAVWDTGSLSGQYSEALFDAGLREVLLPDTIRFSDDATFIAVQVEEGAP